MHTLLATLSGCGDRPELQLLGDSYHKAKIHEMRSDFLITLNWSFNHVPEDGSIYSSPE
ncbi:hypothetical protein HOE425_320204 [Hoeflea sp. EC-HK425]|nr:hypothetical protein HOE425_320204 [Hoeflea sp. EC-HK425]